MYYVNAHTSHYFLLCIFYNLDLKKIFVLPPGIKLIQTSLESSSDDSSADLSNNEFNRYTFLEQIGSGAYGQVYKV